MIKTRLDSRSDTNDRFTVVNSKTGEVVAEIAIAGPTPSTNLVINTADGLHIEKPSGWSSEKT